MRATLGVGPQIEVVAQKSAFAGRREKAVRLGLALVALLLAVVALGMGCGSQSAARSANRGLTRATLARNGLVAYESDAAGPIEVYVMNPDGSHKRRLTH